MEEDLRRPNHETMTLVESLRATLEWRVSQIKKMSADIESLQRENQVLKETIETLKLVKPQIVHTMDYKEWRKNVPFERMTELEKLVQDLERERETLQRDNEKLGRLVDWYQAEYVKTQQTLEEKGGR